MADCAALDEELSSLVFSYLTGASSQYGEEEEVCSDRLDFPDIDLSQLDDLDSVACLGELHWCSGREASPASVHYSSTEELFEIEEENAALLAVLSDSLDMVDAEAVFPALGDEPRHDEDDLPLNTGDSNRSLSSETDDPSLLKKLLLTPPNVPTGSDAHKDGCHAFRHGNRNFLLRPVRPLLKLSQDRKPRYVRPSSRLCTELHRHLTTALPPDSEEDEDEEEEDDEDESESEEEEEGESSSSDVERAEPQPVEPQFTSQRELQSVVELIRYMHTYCIPTRKQQSWERREPPGGARGRPGPPRPEAPLSRPPGPTPRRAPPFSRRREPKAYSLLRELLERSSSFDVSKPYRLHSAPYAQPLHCPRGGSASLPSAPHPRGSCDTSPDPRTPKTEPGNGSSCPHSPERRTLPQVEARGGEAFLVRRSRRLASFPSRFAKRLRLGRGKCGEGEGEEREEELGSRGKGGEGDGAPEQLKEEETLRMNQAKRANLSLPLPPKSTRESQFKSFEQTVDLCGTAGLTPPTTPPHKPVEDELFKPADGAPSPAARLSRASRRRKLPEQTELYAALHRREGEGLVARGGAVVHRTFGDHDYCVLSLGESRRRSAALLAAMLRARGTAGDEPGGEGEELAELHIQQQKTAASMMMSSLVSTCKHQSEETTPPASEEEEGDPSSRSPSPILCSLPASPIQTESSGTSTADMQRIKAKSDEDNYQLFYIHNLPSSVTHNMLRKRFQVFGNADDCKVIIHNEERCGVIKLRSQKQRREKDSMFQNSRASRKRYIDLDEAGPGPVKSKYDALDFDSLLKEAQKSLQR